MSWRCLRYAADRQLRAHDKAETTQVQMQAHQIEQLRLVGAAAPNTLCAEGDAAPPNGVLKLKVGSLEKGNTGAAAGCSCWAAVQAAPNPLNVYRINPPAGERNGNASYMPKS